MTTTREKRSRWGIGVWLLYAGFVVFMLSLAAWAAMQRFDLVEQDYYEQSLTYQQRIEQSQRVLQGYQPLLDYNHASQELSLCFDSLIVPDDAGEILFYRTSDARRDFRVALHVGPDRCFHLSDRRLIPGYWRVKCLWVREGLERYWEGHVFVSE